MADIFDSFGRVIGQSFDDISKDISESLNRVVNQNTNQISKLADLVGRLEKVIYETKINESQFRKKNQNSMVRVDPKDVAAFESAAKSFEKATSTFEKASQTVSKSAFSEKSFEMLGRKLDELKASVASNSLSSATDRFVQSLSKKTLSVHDKGLGKTLSSMMGKGAMNLKAPAQKMPSGFYGSLNKLVKAGLTKGSVYTHDYASESLLTEIMNDIKLAVVALREIAANSGVNRNASPDLIRLFNANLKSRRLDTLSRGSTVTDAVYERFNKRRKGGSRTRGSIPGVGGFNGTPAATYDLEGATADINSASQELVKALKHSNLGLWTKEFAQALGTTPNYIDNGMVGMMDKILKSGQVTADQMEMAAKSAAQAEFMDTHDKRQIKILIDQLNKAGIELTGARASGNPDVATFEKNFEDKYVEVINGLIKTYKNLDGSLAKFDKRVRDTSYALYDLQRVVGLLKPSAFGLGPELKIGDPKAMLREFGQSASDWTKKISAATFESFGMMGDPLKKSTDDLDRMFHDAGTNLDMIYKQTGALGEEFRDVFLKNLKRGITDFNSLNRVTKLGLSLGKTIGADAASTAEEFADWHQFLGMSSDELEVVARRTQQIGKITGITGDNLLQAVKSAKQFAEQMKNAATLTDQAASRFIQISASSKKMGVESQANRLLEGLSGTVPLLTRVNEQTRGFLVQAAMRSGQVQKLVNGTLVQDKDALKSFVGGMEQLFKLFSGGLDLNQIDKISPDNLARLNLQLEAATGLQVGEFKKVIDAFTEGTLTATDKLADVEKQLSGVLAKSDRVTLESQKKQLLLQMGQESFDAQLMRGSRALTRINEDNRIGGGNARQILLEEFGGAAGMKKYAEALLTEVEGFATNAGIGLDTESIRDLRKTVDNLTKGELDVQTFLDSISAAKSTMGGLGKQVTDKNTKRDDFTKLDWEVNKANLELQQKMEGYWRRLMGAIGPENMLRVEQMQSLLSAAISIVNEVQIISQGLVGLAALKFLGSGMLPKFGKTAVAGGSIGTIASGGRGMKAAQAGMLAGGSGALAGSTGTGSVLRNVGGGTAAKAGWLSKLGGVSKIAGPLAVLDLLFGGFTGFSESGGKGSGIINGILTGGNNTGSFLSKYLGIKEGSGGDKAVGVLGAAGRGAMIGAIGGPWGAAIGAVVGGIAELAKIFGIFDGIIDKVSNSFNSLTSSLKKSFGPALDNLGKIFSGIGNAIGKIFDNIGSMFGGSGAMGGFLDTMMGFSAGMLTGGPAGAFAGAIIGFDNMIKALEIMGSVAGTVANGIVYAFGWVSEFVSEGSVFLSDIFSGLWQGAKELLDLKEGQGILSFFSDFRMVVGKAFTEIKSFIDNLNEYMDLAYAKRNIKDMFDYFRIKIAQTDDFIRNIPDQIVLGFARIQDAGAMMVNGIYKAFISTYNEIANSKLGRQVLTPMEEKDVISGGNYDRVLKDIQSKGGLTRSEDRTVTNIALREDERLFSHVSQLSGTANAIKDMTTTKEFKAMSFDTGSGVVSYSEMASQFKSIKTPEEQLKKYESIKNSINHKWHTGWAEYSKGMGDKNGEQIAKGKAMMKDAGTSLNILDMAYKEAGLSIPTTVKPVKPEIPKAPTPTSMGTSINSSVGVPGFSASGTMPSPLGIPGSPSLLASTGGLPFRAPKTSDEFADIGNMNRIAMNLAPIFHKATADGMVNLRTLDIIAADIYGQLRGKKNWTDSDFDSAVKSSFKKHLGKDVTDSVKLPDISRGNDINSIITGAASSIASTAGENPILSAAQAIQQQAIATDNEKNKIEESNAHLSTIENNSKDTNELLKINNQLMTQILAMMSGGKPSGTPRNPSSRPVISAPPNYYEANMSPNSIPGMGNVTPR